MTKIFKIMIWNLTLGIEFESLSQESFLLTQEYHQLSCCTIRTLHKVEK